MGYDLLFQQAVKLHEAGELDKAENIYRQILETAPDNADILNLMGMIAQARGIHDQACNWFYKASRQAPSSAHIYFNLGLSLFNDNKPIEAIAAYQKSITLQSDIKETYNYLAEVYRALGETENAISNYQKALRLDPQYLDAKINLASLQKDIPTLEEIVRRDSDNVMAIYYLSRLYPDDKAYSFLLEHDFPVYDIQLRLGELALTFAPQKAENYFQKALDLNPYSVSAHINLGNFAVQKQEWQRAEKLYKRAIELDKNNFEAHAGYAQMLHLSGRKAEALDEYRAAVILNPDSPEISNNLGLILKDIQDYTEALGLFFNAFSKDKTKEEYQINIAETLTLLYYQNPDEAKKIAANWHKQNPDNPFANHMNAALNGETSETDQVYTQKLFDNFADNYELVLANIGYRLPREFREITGSVEGTIVDFGCGSGLIGVAYKTAFSNIIGVDLSEKMLAFAEEKNCYDRLVREDIFDFAQRELSSIRPKLITAADVCCYTEELEPLLKACAPYPLIFSIEQASDDIKKAKLLPTGRYQHNPQYIAELLAKYYTTIDQHPTILRKENGEDVKGIIFYCR
ncbi:MAG: tetratricopeptide repeat protein [Alphaproteobacteria bacterium]|nr:tetratricopeptide repeat protein [Alphaproteobacteria bacterium]